MAEVLSWQSSLIGFVAQLQERYQIRFPQARALDLERLLELLPCQEASGLKTAMPIPPCAGFTLRPAHSLQPICAPCPCAQARTQLDPKRLARLFRFNFSELRPQSVLHEAPLAWHQAQTPDEAQSHILEILFSLAARSDRPFRREPGFAQVNANALHGTHKSTVKFLDKLIAFYGVFFSKNAQFLEWTQIQEAFSPFVSTLRAHQQVSPRENMMKILSSSRLVVLNLAPVQFRIKAGSNPEISAFENFLSEASRFDCALVCSSLQPLVRARAPGRSAYTPRYFAPTQKKSKPPIQEILRQGCFDRLLELLMRGQFHLDALHGKGGHID